MSDYDGCVRFTNSDCARDRVAAVHSFKDKLSHTACIANTVSFVSSIMSLRFLSPDS